MVSSINRKLNKKRCASPFIVFYPDPTPVFVYNSVRDEKSQPCALSSVFGGEKGIKDLIHVALFNPRARV